MADDMRRPKREAVHTALDNMKLEEGASPSAESDSIAVDGKSKGTPRSNDFMRSPSNTPLLRRGSSQSLIKESSACQTPKSEDDGEEEIIGGDITVTVEPGQTPKLSRKKSQKVISRPPPLFTDLEDATEEAKEVFQVIPSCLYGSKYMGSSGDHDALDCDCNEQFKNGKNYACGEDSDCINRATKMECVDGDCNCGIGCQNTRIQRKQYANVSVIKTEKKGYGLRANADLNSHDFIFEYIGEVIGEAMFRRRTIQYDAEGIKHFYFMSLTKSEFVDATRKGNLGRFCNHSCNPNCYVDKWVVGDKLRMGIFAERPIKAGEELVFNYNVDRYGADPQPCYCGEPNCSGFIGGKTQTERATKLSHATIEALGIDDGDGWDTAVAKKPRKKKTGEDDEEYVNNVQPKGLDEEGVRKVMATLMQCKEKWIAVKLLSRIQRCDDDRVRNRVVQMHGYQILRTTLTTWKDDNNVILQILDILYKFPRLTRNKISDSKIEAPITELTTSEHEDVAFESKRLLEEWSKLEVAYRIPRRRFDPNAVSVYERRNTDRPEEVTKSPAPEKIVAPTGPRSNLPQRTAPFAPRPPIRRNFNALPTGWFQAMDANGNTYYYSKAGSTTWQRPTIPAAEPPPPPKQPPESVQKAKALQDIIDSITKAEASPKSATPAQASTPKEKKKPAEKWRAYPEEKKMKLYENTLFPHIKHVMQKFTKSLPKEDLKKFAKEVGKKLVSSDFKNGRVEDPTKITEKQEKKVKAYVRAYFEKAVEKKRELDKRKSQKPKESGKVNGNGSTSKAEEAMSPGVEVQAEEVDFQPDPIEITPSPPASPGPETPDLKRKREEDSDTPSASYATSDLESFKRLKEENGSEMEAAPTPPPPPPPGEGMGLGLELGEGMSFEGTMNEDSFMQNGNIDVSSGFVGGVGLGVRVESEEDRELRKQEEELMRENEEAEKGVVEEMGAAGVVNGSGMEGVLSH